MRLTPAVTSNNLPAMPNSNRTVPALVGFVLIVAIAAGVYYRMTLTESHTLSGRIRMIDQANRSATLEIINSENGQTIEITGDVLPDCQITLNGRPAALSDLVLGDEVVVDGERHRNHRLTAHRIQATRDGG
ncbi:MAG: hypothetical protein V3T70_00150 [Phycisphaerae bacterium]